MDVGCIVLAGGRGLRLGRDKVLATIGGRSLLQQTISHVGRICKEVIVVTAGKRDLPCAADHLRLRQVADVFPGKGPLGGIYTGLVASGFSHNLVVASDMPFLNEALLRYMINLSDGFDAVVPRVDELVEPLHAVYSKECIAPIEAMIKQDQLGVNGLLGLVRVRYVDAEEIDQFDPQHLSFFNVNTKADMDRARQLARGMTDDKR